MFLCNYAFNIHKSKYTKLNIIFKLTNNLFTFHLFFYIEYKFKKIIIGHISNSTETMFDNFLVVLILRLFLE